MKYIMLLPVVFLLLSAMGAGAITEPMPIAVKVTAAYPNDLGVTVENLRTSESMFGNTNQYGEIIFDWANSNLGYETGDVFRVSVKGESVEVTYDDVPFGVINVDLTSDCPECPSVECPSITDKLDIICPEIDELCPDELSTKCSDLYPCPETETGILNYLIGAGIAALGAAGLYLGKKKVTKEEKNKLEEGLGKGLSVGSGFRAYKHTDGKTRFKHLHYGIMGYHDPLTRHMNPKVRHEPGQLLV